MPTITASPVGVAAFALPDGAPPFRIFYPSVEHDTSKHPRATVFRFGVRKVVMSYIHTIGGIFLPSLKHGRGLFQLVSMCLWPLLVAADLLVTTLRLVPAFRVPLSARDEPPLQPPPAARYPAVLFSHGLTGIGEEHASLFAALAQRGFVVIAPTHCDGSAALSKAGSADVFYTHPDMKSYDRNFRLEQVQRRADEINAVRRFVFGGEGAAAPGLLGEICSAVDPARVVLGGFSYGAATTALVAAGSADADFRGLVLLDGWFHIDLRRVKIDDEIAFPPLAHAKGLGPPALFVGSESFANMKGMARHTGELQSRCRGGVEAQVVPGTTHFDFMDLVLWLPTFLHPLLRKAKIIGTPDARHTLQTINSAVIAFAERVTK